MAVAKTKHPFHESYLDTLRVNIFSGPSWELRKRDGKTRSPADQQTIILITHETTEQAIRNALERIETDGHLAAHAQMFRIEK